MLLCSFTRLPTDARARAELCCGHSAAPSTGPSTGHDYSLHRHMQAGRIGSFRLTLELPTRRCNAWDLPFWAEQHETMTEFTKIKLDQKLNSTHSLLRTLFLASLASTTGALPYLCCVLRRLPYSTSRTRMYSYSISQPFVFPSLSSRSLPPPTPDGVDAAVFLPLFAVLEGTFTSGLHCVDTRPSAAKTGPGWSPARCSVFRTRFRTEYAAGYSVRGILAASAAKRPWHAPYPKAQLARLLCSQRRIPKNPQTRRKSARICGCSMWHAVLEIRRYVMFCTKEKRSFPVLCQSSLSPGYFPCFHVFMLFSFLFTYLFSKFTIIRAI